MVVLGAAELAAPAPPEPGGWAEADPARRLVRVAVVTPDLQASTTFCARHFKLLLQTPLDFPGVPARALLAAEGDGGTALELVEAPAAAVAEAAAGGDAAGHHFFTAVVDDVGALLEALGAEGRGGAVVDAAAAAAGVRAPTDEGGQTRTDRVAVVKDPGGHVWRATELRGRGAPPAPRLAALALRVPDLSAALRWWVGAAGARVASTYEAAVPPTFRTATLRFGPAEAEAGAGEAAGGGTRLELREIAPALEPPPSPGAGDGLLRLVLGTADLERTAAALELAAGAAPARRALAGVDALGGEEAALCAAAPGGVEVCFVAARP
jgi:catechol 2,3-dioxygenase-like lactoylglutathione lyase family enzyme